MQVDFCMLATRCDGSGSVALLDPDFGRRFSCELLCAVLCCGSGSCIVSDPATGRVFFNVLFCTVLRHESGSGTGMVPGSVCEFFNVLVCTDALAGGGGIGDGRLRASATTFLGPGTCLKSVVNSEMYANWRTCLADQGAETRLMAKVSGK